MDNGHFVGMILLDLQNAFYTVAVDYSILSVVCHMEISGLGDNILRWFNSYSSD